MTGSELKIIRESLGLSAEWMADMSGVSLRSYRYWEASDSIVKQDVADSINKLDTGVDSAVTAALDIVSSANLERVVLIRYKSEDDLWLFRKDMNGMPLAIHNAILQRLRKMILNAGIACFVKWMDRESYLEWLGSREDSEATRADWATNQ